MLTEAKFSKIFDLAIKDISKRVAKTEVVNREDAEVQLAKDLCTLITKTEGDYNLTIVLCTDCNSMKNMARNMKRGSDASDEEVSIYMREYFNILCGHVVSAMNQSEHLKAQFSVPNLVHGRFNHSPAQPVKFRAEYYYDSPYGTIKVEALCS